MSRLVAVVVTWRLERELDRLLTSLETSGCPPDRSVVVDHAGTVPPAAQSFPVHVFSDLLNPGPGAGWANGACLLVTNDSIASTGLPRPGFWMLGADLEYSMRLARNTQAVFTCLVSVPHLRPEPADPEAARASDYRKFCSLLQNLA